jgi:tRNA(His) 5'-end guanylyltransferase
MEDPWNVDYVDNDRLQGLESSSKISIYNVKGGAQNNWQPKTKRKGVSFKKSSSKFVSDDWSLSDDSYVNITEEMRYKIEVSLTW